MRIGVVVPCRRQEGFLPRTIAALERALEGSDWRGVLVSSADAASLPALSARWEVVAPCQARRVPGSGHGGPNGGDPCTPGAARMRGFAVCGGDWVLFVDADVEMESAWVSRALALAEAAGDGGTMLAGLGGRLEEWFVDGRAERPGAPDLLRVGRDERTVDYLTTPVLYRREALAAVGGYDVRLCSEEDFELGLRLRRFGYELRSLGLLAARHWSAPRPSLRELARRWRTGICFGTGQVLRVYFGHHGFGTLLLRQRLYLAALAMWILGAAACGAWIAYGTPRPLALWALVPLAVIGAMALRKRSVRLGIHSLLTWTLQGFGLVVGLFYLPAGPSPAGSREAAC